MLRHIAVQRNQPPGFIPGSYVNYRCPPAKGSIAIYINYFLSGYAVKAVLSGFAVKAGRVSKSALCKYGV